MRYRSVWGCVNGAEKGAEGMGRALFDVLEVTGSEFSAGGSAAGISRGAGDFDSIDTADIPSGDAGTDSCGCAASGILCHGVDCSGKGKEAVVSAGSISALFCRWSSGCNAGIWSADSFDRDWRIH